MPGHEPGHEQIAPAGLDWDGYLAHFVNAVGGWAPLGDELISRATGTVDISLDVQTVEKGLRRLATRGQLPGGRYGEWMLRFFGLPPDVDRLTRWIGQYHSRFSDLPARLRLEQLRLWNRPPVSESRHVAWIHLGLASVYLRLRRSEDAEGQLEHARRSARRAGPAAQIETKLLEAKLATDEGDREGAVSLLEEVSALLSDEGLDTDDAACYRARLLDQRAYHLTKPQPGDDADLPQAQALFEQIGEDPNLPFVCFRRFSGLAYCAWKRGDPSTGAAYARKAAQYAGDGGLVRFRVMALRMLSGMLEGEQAQTLLERAQRLALQLDDEDLLARSR